MSGLLDSRTIAFSGADDSAVAAFAANARLARERVVATPPGDAARTGSSVILARDSRGTVARCGALLGRTSR
jgi:hypothetical protein